MGVVHVAESVLEPLETLDERAATGQVRRERLEEIPQVLGGDPRPVDLRLIGLTFDPCQATPQPSSRASDLPGGDARGVGRVRVPFEPNHDRVIQELAPEPLDEAFNADYLYRVTRRRRVAIKLAIMNSHLVVGVGNIYASEALFRARIRPRRRARTLTRVECARLARAIKATLTLAVKVGGTTLRDYVGADGNPGYFRQKLYVYERAGKPCRVCGRPIRQFTQGQRSTYWCSYCQK